jgi:hypothetical protein
VPPPPTDNHQLSWLAVAQRSRSMGKTAFCDDLPDMGDIPHA